MVADSVAHELGPSSTPLPEGRPLRVAHLIVGLARAGAETALLRLISDTRGTVEHHVVGMTSESALATEMEAAGARVTVLGSSRRILNPMLPLHSASALLRHSPDVVHAWMLHAAALWSICRIDARIRRTPCVWGIRSSLNPGAESISIRLAAACARAASAYPRAIMFNSECARAQHDRFGFCMDRASVTHNGVDVPDEGDVLRWRHAIRAKLGIVEEAIVFAHVARAHPHKGVGDFVRAAEIVRDRFGTRAVFLRVGKPGWETGQSAADVALERSPILYHAGEQQNSRPWLAAADICVMSSLRESCPNVVLESMSVGTPVVVTNVGDAAQLVGSCGWVAPPKSLWGLAESMIAAASCVQRSSEKVRLWMECRSKVLFGHSRAEVARRQIDIYRNAIKNGTADGLPAGAR